MPGTKKSAEQRNTDWGADELWIEFPYKLQRFKELWMERQTHTHRGIKSRTGGARERQPYSLESRKYNYIQWNYSSLTHMPLAVAGFTSTFQSWPLKWIRYNPFKRSIVFCLYTCGHLYLQHLSSCVAQQLVDASFSCVKSERCPTSRVQRRLPSSPVARKVLLRMFQTQLWSLGIPVTLAG